MTVVTRGRPGDEVRLDLFQKIVNIHWPNTKDLLLIETFVQRNRPLPPISLAGFPFEPYSLEALKVNRVGLPKATQLAPVAYPEVTKEMRSTLQVFSWPLFTIYIPASAPGSIPFQAIRSWNFINLRGLKAKLDGEPLRFELTFPGAQAASVSPATTIYGVYAAAGNTSFEEAYELDVILQQTGHGGGNVLYYSYDQSDALTEFEKFRVHMNVAFGSFDVPNPPYGDSLFWTLDVMTFKNKSTFRLITDRFGEKVDGWTFTPKSAKREVGSTPSGGTLQKARIQCEMTFEELIVTMRRTNG
jgi:hypothetical protein